MTTESNDETPSIFLPDFESMTVDDLRAYIARSRRQLERFERLPGAAGKPIDPEEAATIRRLCDELEASLDARDKTEG
ncbi:MAG: hypothetical protein ABL967_01450 [Bryobacteraceae bacterium]